MAETSGIRHVVLFDISPEALREAAVARLLAAYNDSAGVAGAFNRNVFAVLNRELHAEFALDRIAHRAVWNDRRARSRCAWSRAAGRRSA